MKTKVKVKEIFYHIKTPYAVGEETEFTKGDAEDLAKAGLVEILDDKAPAADTKMEAAPKNKMADSPVNKASKKAD